MKGIKTLAVVIALASATLLQGCTTPLAAGQEQEYDIYEHKGLAVHEKNVAVAGVVGILPAAGYFYTGHPVLAITTLPLYIFLGPLWMPFDAMNAAKVRNYYQTKIQVERTKANELQVLDRRLEDKSLTYEQHLREQRLIESKYSAY